MKSLHQYMKDKGLDQALRLDTNPPTMQALDLKTTKGGGGSISPAVASPLPDLELREYS